MIGSQIERLYFRYRFEADPKRKKRIEQYILATYQKHIDNLLSEKKVLLPPPDPQKAKGEYPLGEIIYDNKLVSFFGLREHEFIRHIGMYGVSGSGKSNVVFKLIDELLIKNKKVFVFDWKRQYRDFLSIRPNADVLIFGVGNKNIPTFQFNPLIPPIDFSPDQHIEIISQIIANSYYLGEGCIAILRTLIKEKYKEFGVYDGDVKVYPTFKDILNTALTKKSIGRSRDWYDSTLRSLQAICHGALSKIVNVQKPSMQLSELLNHNVFLELGDLGQSQKMFIIQSLLTYIYYYSMNRGIKEKFLNAIIIEEAHHILRDHSNTIKEPISDIIFKEIREFSVSMILIDQNPSLISLPAIANNYVTIGLYTKHSKDINALSSAMFLKPEERDFLGKLECGHGIVKLAGRIFEPFLVRFPHMKIKKGSINDSIVGIHMLKKGFCMELDLKSVGIDLDNNKDNNILNSFQTDSNETSKETIGIDDINKINTCSKSDEKKENQSNGITTSNHYKDKKEIRTTMVKDIDEYPYDGVAKRNKRLKISVRKGNEAIQELIDSGIINKVEISETSGRKCLLEITQDARKQLLEKGAKIRKINKYEGGIEHRYWNHKIAEINRKAGYKVELEKYIDGVGYIDQFIEKGGKKIAIEIETGNSKPIDTIKRDLDAGCFDKVVCVAINDNTYKSIIEKLNVKTDIGNGLIIRRVSHYIHENKT